MVLLLSDDEIEECSEGLLFFVWLDEEKGVGFGKDGGVGIAGWVLAVL